MLCIDLALPGERLFAWSIGGSVTDVTRLVTFVIAYWLVFVFVLAYSFICWQQRQHKYLRGTNCPHHKHFTRPQKLRFQQNWKILSLFSVCSLLIPQHLGIMFTHLSTFFAKHLRKQRKYLPASQMVPSLHWSFWKWTQTTTTNNAQPNSPNTCPRLRSGAFVVLGVLRSYVRSLARSASEGLATPYPITEVNDKSLV